MPSLLYETVVDIDERVTTPTSAEYLPTSKITQTLTSYWWYGSHRPAPKPIPELQSPLMLAFVHTHLSAPREPSRRLGASPVLFSLRLNRATTYGDNRIASQFSYRRCVSLACYANLHEMFATGFGLGLETLGHKHFRSCALMADCTL